jgi:hypothetical protein
MSAWLMQQCLTCECVNVIVCQLAHAAVLDLWLRIHECVLVCVSLDHAAVLDLCMRIFRCWFMSAVRLAHAAVLGLWMRTCECVLVYAYCKRSSARLVHTNVHMWVCVWVYVCVILVRAAAHVCLCYPGACSSSWSL